MSSLETRIVFFQVREPQAKLFRLAEMVRSHFEKKEHLTLFVEDDSVLKYVDELLWKLPETSFLPHAIAEDSTSDWIALTKSKKNVNGARFAFNLCSTPLLIEAPFRIIYDFEDLTSPNRKHLSSLRFDAYKQAHFLIEAR